MSLPSGTVTFLFTDIEGSTKLWEQHPDAMRTALTRHDTLLRQAIEDNHGVVVKSTGDGVLAAFHTAPAGIAAALTLQRAVLAEPWPEYTPIRVRAALHVGTAEYRDGDYYGSTLNRAARLLATGHGQQTLLSQATHELICDCLPADVTMLDMGRHRLKDLLAPEHVWQLLHPSLPAEFQPLKSLDYLPTNLPRQTTSFIGREKEIEEVKRLLPSTPLLTLLATGGTGKTRLALQVGADVLEEYKDGIWLVELAAISDPDLVPQTLATALGLCEEPGRPLWQIVQEYLRDRHLLLILDNCEHLVSACAHVADALLKNCPHLTILATSREALGIAGEHAWRVPSLLTPGPTDLVLEEKDMAAVLMEYDACRLFVERAVLQRQDFVLTPGNVPVVAHLCQQLDGIPLAIELAAARVRSLSVEEIKDRLDHRFRLLTGGSRTAMPRQRTLRALVDWSYDLLGAQEKALLDRLSVFAGGWTLGAAEDVCRDHEIEAWEVVDFLTSLVDKSLVVYEEREGRGRYRLLAMIRQYAEERLDERREAKEVKQRHLTHFLALAEEAESKLKGVDQAEWLQRLEAEHENLWVALESSLEEETAAVSLRLCGALQQFWWMRGHLSEGREWCVRALGRANDAERTLERAKALNGAGNLASDQGDYAAARAYYEESLSIRREFGDRSGIAASLNGAGNLASDQGDYAAARAYYEESLSIRRELGDRQGIAASLNNLGNLACYQGDYAAARAYHEESLSIEREIGDRSGIAALLNNLGSVAFEQGDYAAAITYHEESLGIKREMGDRRGIAISLINLGSVAFEQGDYPTARAYQKESLSIKREIGDRDGIAKSLESFAALALKESRPEHAAALWGAAERLREVIGAPPPPNGREEYDRIVAALRTALGEEAFAAAWAEGRAMTMEQAIDYGLQDAG